MTTPGKGRKIAAWILTGLLTLMLLFSAVMKLVAAQPVVEVFTKWGLMNHMVLIGIGELVSALLFAIPRTHSLGVLLLSAYLGGAIVTHMQHGEPYFSPAIGLVLVWLTAYLRQPEMFQSLRGQTA